MRTAAHRHLTVATPLIIAGLLAALVLVLVASPAAAKPGAKPSVTKIWFHLDDHEVAVGEALTADITIGSNVKPGWADIDGAVLSVQIGGVEVASLTTDASGHAALSYVTTEEGGGAIKIVYAGDDLHKRAKRAQGFQVTAVEDPAEPPEEEDPPTV